MSDIIIIAAFLSFLVFFIGGKYRRYAAIAGWTCIVLNLWSEIPALLHEANFLYPLLALLSLPFLAITADCLLREDKVVLQLTRAAAIATVILVPFMLIPALGNGLIGLVVMVSFTMITALGHHPEMLAWDVIFENGFANQIILGCTGIMAIAMMLGIVFAEKNLTSRQAVQAFLIIVPPIFLLNLLRVSVIFIAVSDKWFDSLPDPTGTGDANFFWAHNVCAEVLGLVFLLVLTGILLRVIPDIGIFGREVIRVYRNRLLNLTGR